MINKDYPFQINRGVNKVTQKGVTAFVAHNLCVYGVRHLFSTRVGGVSEGAYESMNLSWRQSDSMENIKKNFSIIADAYEFDENNIVFAEQTHSASVAYVGNEDKNGMRMKEHLIPNVDALITDQKNVVLTARTADCVPVLLYDGNGAIAAIHSGWKGTVNNITGNTIAEMIERFGSNPADMIAVIGPSIGPCCFEVQADVSTPFIEAGYEECVYSRDGKTYVDLWRCCVMQLFKAGVPEENITLANECTCCNKEMFFSHRREKGNTGGMTAFIELV